MTDFLLTALAAAIGYLVTVYIHGAIFAASKADKYEDVLADKIAKKVKAELEGSNL